MDALPIKWCVIIKCDGIDHKDDELFMVGSL
jgi:hypothetical protein